MHAGLIWGAPGESGYTLRSLELLASILGALAFGALLLAMGLSRSFRAVIRTYGTRRGGGRVTLVRAGSLIGGLTILFFGYGIVWIALFVPISSFYFTHGPFPATPPEAYMVARLLLAVGSGLLAAGLAIVGSVEFHRRALLRTLADLSPIG
ncbi:MAG: hypothetical protein L3K02_00450 [Thermoplasmata archaeon]|nr:hypothetical protein [Thermoplasmata archaeon]